MKVLFSSLIFVSVSLSVSNAHAWGRRGHALVAETAAYLVADKQPFFKEMSYNLGYYSNVPDVIWKSEPEIYKIEGNEHFMDLEIFERAMKGGPWIVDRKAFETKYDVIKKAGRAYWRISELDARLKDLSEQLSQFPKDGKPETRMEIQGNWFVTAGVIGHYVGDLAQPLHVTENYDGQMSDQKGIHEFFETDSVNELHPELAALVLKNARAKWSAFSKKHASVPVFELIQTETAASFKLKEEIYKIDKKAGRNLKKAAPKFKNLIIDRLTDGSLYLALIWSRHLQWVPVTEKFYHFDGKPEYIRPSVGVSK